MGKTEVRSHEVWENDPEKEADQVNQEFEKKDLEIKEGKKEDERDIDH